MKWVFVILLAALPLFGQNVWGDGVLFGNTFTNTDSTQISAYRDSLRVDTLYSDLLPISRESNGRAVCVASFASDSVITVTLWARLYYGGGAYVSKDTLFTGTMRTAALEWGAWNQVGGALAGSVVYVTDLAEQSWWNPALGIQYSIRETDAAHVSTYSIREFRN